MTFGDGAKGKVVDMGQQNYPGLPMRQDVILVESLIANLINISLLCDQGLLMNFSIDKCIVSDNNNTTVLGTRSSDDCYLWVSNVFLNACNSVRNNEASLWHKRLGQVNL